MRIVKFSIFESHQTLSKDQIEFLDSYCKGEWVINPKTGLIDIKGDFLATDKDLEDLRDIKFGRVTGSFKINENYIESLEGCPEEVGEEFNCGHNNLKSLKGAPQKVGYIFDCRYNELENLEGGPSQVGDSYICYFNQLKSLKGAPKTVIEFQCGDNQLETLEGGPEICETDFGCSRNKLKTLEGGLKKCGNLFANSNQLEDLKGCPEVLWAVKVAENKLTSLEGIKYTDTTTFRFIENPVSPITFLKILNTMKSDNVSYDKALELTWPDIKLDDKMLLIRPHHKFDNIDSLRRQKRVLDRGDIY